MIKSFRQKDITFIKNLFLTTILGGIIGILNYLFNIFVVRYTNQEIFSIFTASLGIIYIVQIPATSIQTLLTKIVAKNDNNNLQKYKWESLISFGIIGAISSLLFFFFKQTISSIASIPENTVAYLAITLLFSFLSPIYKAFLLGEERIISFNLLMLLETVLKFAIGAIAIKMGGTLSLLILASSLPSIITSLVMLPLIKVNRSGSKIKTNYKDFILITLFILFLTLPYTIDLVLVNSEFRAEYGSISLLGKLVYFSSIMTASVMFARVSNENQEKNRRRSLIISLILALSIGLVISLMYFVMTDLVIKLTIGEQYLAVGKYLGLFGVCMSGFAVVYMVANYFISQNIYSYMVILFASSLLQILLFKYRNSSLDIVIQNQLILYGILSLSTIFFLIYKFMIKRNEKDRTKD